MIDFKYFADLQPDIETRISYDPGVKHIQTTTPSSVSLIQPPKGTIQNGRKTYP